MFVDELGMEVPENMDFFDIEEYLKAAKEAYRAVTRLLQMPNIPDDDQGWRRNGQNL